MCGFIAFSHKSENGVADLCEWMMHKISHRGPDENNKKIFKNIALGHVRLNILDLKTGKQPLSYDDLTIVFNGEIYNHNELRNNLKSLGYTFQTTSDTEVLLKGFHKFGPKFIEKLNGIYSFLIFDKNTDKVYLSRDFFGVKPLYYLFDDYRLIIASELKAIISFIIKTEQKISFNDNALKEFLLKGYIKEFPLISGVKALSTGKLIQMDLITREIKNLHSISLESKSSSLQDIEKIIKHQISLELQADVEVGVLLSGGIDSSLLTVLAKDLLQSKKIKTFSIGFKDSEDIDESYYSKEVSKICNTKHYVYFFTEENLLNSMDDFILCMDQPIYDPAMLPLLFLSKNVKKEVKAVISGDGGDELFGGYTKYWAFKFKRLLNFILLFKSVLRPINPKIKIIENLLTDIEDSKGPFYFHKKYLNSIPLFQKRKPSHFRELMKIDIENELQHKLLVKTDLASMFHGLEVRTPFLNNTLYSASLGLKDDLLLDCNKGKVVLRKILSKFLPKKIVNKKKQGFRVPIEKWVSKGTLGKDIDKELRENLHISEQVISKSKIEELLKFKKEFSTPLFSLYILNKWIQKNSAIT